MVLRLKNLKLAIGIKIVESLNKAAFGFEEKERFISDILKNSINYKFFRMDLWQFNTISFIYLFAACMSFTVAIIAWRKRPERTAGLFSLLAFSVGIWAIGYFFGFFNKDIGVKFIMLRIEFLGIFSSCYLWFIFVSTYTNQDKWLKSWVKVALVIIPLLSYFQILFLDYHNFFYKSTSIAQINDFFVLQKEYGTGFYIAILYNYLLIISGTLLVLSSIIRMPSIFRRQNFILIIVVIVMLVTNFLYLTGNNPIKPYDPTPLSFALASILFLFSFYNFRFLNIVPVAYSLVFKNIKNGVLIIDKRERIVGMNSAAELILNSSLKKALGKPIVDLFSNSKEVIKRFLTKNEVKTEIFIGKDECVYELQISALEDNSNNIIGRIFVLYDISEQKKAYEELDAFARTVAHDLKSPLSAVIGFSDLLSTNSVDKEKSDSYLNQINISANKMVKIIDALLLLAKIRHVEKIHKAVLNSEQIVDSAVSRLSNLITESNAKIVKSDTWFDVIGYSEWVEVVWVNYISNAIKYGGKPPVITLSSQRIGTMVQMSVTDNGDGITEEDQALLFTEFTRLYKQENEIGGHGLGLSIVRRIIHKLGGQVGVKSKPGSSTFFFTLPTASIPKLKELNQ